MKKYSKGFTLIELLVVIAIIGILSSVVLASLNTARSKGSDAAIKSNIGLMRSQSEVVYDTLGAKYGTQEFSTACGAITVATPATTIFNDVNSQTQIDAAVTVSGTDATCVSSDTAYLIAVKLKADTTKGWCVDNSSAKQITWANLASGDTKCDDAL